MTTTQTSKDKWDGTNHIKFEDVDDRTRQLWLEYKLLGGKRTWARMAVTVQFDNGVDSDRVNDKRKWLVLPLSQVRARLAWRVGAMKLGGPALTIDDSGKGDPEQPKIPAPQTGEHSNG